MIQRIQSIFLLLAAIAMACLFFMPYVEVRNDDYFILEYTPQLLFTIIVILGLLASIFLFRNRPLQFRITRAMILILVAFVGYSLYQLYLVDFKAVEFEPGGLLPIFSAYFAARAARKIKADEKLVRSVDRLR